MKHFEETLPDNYHEIFVIDAKDKKTSMLILAGTFIIAIVTILPFIPHFDITKLNLNTFVYQWFIMMAAMIIYIICHELVHGLAYKLLTGHKLTFGITLTVAYCGVPDIYVYRKAALISLLAPFTVFNIVFIGLVILCWNNMNFYVISVILLANHISGCIGDLYDSYLLLTKYKDEKLLVNDTGPKQTFYMSKEKKDYRAIIFDLDGTLLDTLEDLADSVNSALREYGYPERSLQQVRSFIGHGVRNLMKQASGADENSEHFDQMCTFQKEYYTANCMNYTKPYEGIIELLKNLKQQGYITAIVSNKFDSAVRMLAENYFPGLIELAVGESETVRKKPFPDSIMAVISHFGLNKDDVVYIGDSEVDIETAHNAEIDCIAVSYGFRDRDLLKTDIIADSVSQLHDLLLNK